MEIIYTGKEKNLHLKLVERMMSEEHINAKDIAYIHFTVPYTIKVICVYWHVYI